MKENEPINIQENLISQKDRERLDSLFAEIGEGNSLDWAFPSFKERNLVEKLQNEGTIAAKYLLEKIKKYRKMTKNVYCIAPLKICKNAPMRRLRKISENCFLMIKSRLVRTVQTNSTSFAF